MPDSFWKLMDAGLLLAQLLWALVTEPLTWTLLGVFIFTEVVRKQGDRDGAATTEE